MKVTIRSFGIGRGGSLGSSWVPFWNLTWANKTELFHAILGFVNSCGDWNWLSAIDTGSPGNFPLHQVGSAKDPFWKGNRIGTRCGEANLLTHVTVPSGNQTWQFFQYPFYHGGFFLGKSSIKMVTRVHCNGHHFAQGSPQGFTWFHPSQPWKTRPAKPWNWSSRCATWTTCSTSPSPRSCHGSARNASSTSSRELPTWDRPWSSCTRLEGMIGMRG